ncbi:hypothetical protein CHS0354_007917 [Potamilus streckersoni]|uniref:Uncharacterized protein n=1 Tax=Potamilus streckersoni TaxID=2493646 RepID=A0AAE0VSI4_9BIVA|nr:hypothetical protein CHS0354_007917 [Potamilus streckersoni]
MTSDKFLRSLPLPVRFPGYFRGPEEQMLAEERLLSRTFLPAPNGTVDGLVNTCNGVCHRPTDWKPLSPSIINHACCISIVVENMGLIMKMKPKDSVSTQPTCCGTLK